MEEKIELVSEGIFLSWGAESERKLREGECGWGQSLVAEGRRGSALRAFCVEEESLGLEGESADLRFQ